MFLSSTCVLSREQSDWAHVSTTDGPGAGAGGDDRGDPGRGPPACRPGGCGRPVPALHRPGPRDGALGALPLLRRSRRPPERADPRRLRVAGRRGRAGGGGRRAASGEGDAARWRAVPRALRTWALAHPHEWGLIFGTPVPGYEAPEETVEPYARIVTALVRPIVEAEAAGRLQTASARGRDLPRAARRGGTGERRALPPHAGGEGGAGHPGLDDHRRRHQPRGLRALAQHDPRIRASSSRPPSAPKRIRSACADGPPPPGCGAVPA